MVYRVYTRNGALIYHGRSANVAQEMYEIGEQEEQDADKAEELAVADQANKSDNPMAKAQGYTILQWAFDEPALHTRLDY